MTSPDPTPVNETWEEHHDEVTRLRTELATAHRQVDRSIRRARELEGDHTSSRPHIVCICGSMRFQDVMLNVSVDESLAGHIVVLPLVNMKHPDDRWATENQADQIKTGLDRLHFAKIDLADEVLVVNPGGYVGDSTKREIAYADETGKPIRYLVPNLGTGRRSP
jgi:hypothetical protein